MEMKAIFLVVWSLDRDSSGFSSIDKDEYLSSSFREKRQNIASHPIDQH